MTRDEWIRQAVEALKAASNATWTSHHTPLREQLQSVVLNAPLVAEHGVEVSVQLGEDGTPVVFIDTDEKLEEGQPHERGYMGPKIRVRINNALIYPSYLFGVAKLRGAVTGLINELKAYSVVSDPNVIDEIEDAQKILEETNETSLSYMTREPEDVIPEDKK